MDSAVNRRQIVRVDATLQLSAEAKPASNQRRSRKISGGIDNPGYLAFFDALVEGRLKMGDTLTQSDLGAILGLSLSPMRETTTLLEAEGLITVRRRVGITVFYPDVEFVGNTFQLRGLIEREGLRKFMRAVPVGWVMQMRQSHLDIVAFVTSNPAPTIYREPVKALEGEFHGSFVEAFSNRELSDIYWRLSQKMFILRLLHLDAVGPSATVKSMAEHQTVITAIENGDADHAVDCLERHFSGVLHRILAK